MNVELRGDGDGIDGTIEKCGGRIVEAETTAEPELVVTSGEPATLSLAGDPPDAPVVPITPGGGVHAVPRGRAETALRSVFEGAYRTVSHPVIGLELAGEELTRAVADVMLLTREPAHISEYGVSIGEDHGEQFRADGVVVATPLGSDGYAGAAGGPTIAPGSGLSIVPVAPFSTHARTWVSQPPLALTVERDEGAVILLADGVETAEIPPWEPVELAAVDSFELVRTAETGTAE